MATSVGNINIEITSSVQNAINAVNSLKNATSSSSTNVKNMTSSFRGMGSAANSIKSSISGLTSMLLRLGGIYSVSQFLRTAIVDSSALIENYNLMSVAVKSLSSDEADYNTKINETLKFQNQLNSSFGVMISNSIRYQGFFMNLASSLGLSNEASITLSKNMTQLTYDLASLYNVDFNTMYSKLQSGLVGQTKPLRSVGIDVTMQTLQPTLYSLDINKKVSELTQAQKVMLRYIEILRQSTTAQGDLARTIEQPANQIRILKDQWAELVTWVGTLFIGILGRVLPALNGIVMALKNVFKYISDIFGFRLSDYTSSMAVAGEDASIIADYLDEANTSAEETRKSLMGFDELNLLNDQSLSIVPIEDLGVTEKLEAAMKSYDNLMDSVKTKASNIADSIMSWLGFTKEINDKTGEVQYKFTGISDISLTNITNSMKNLWSAIKEFAINRLDDLTTFYNSFIKPISTVIMNETIPNFIDLVSDALNLYNVVYEIAKPYLKDFYDRLAVIAKLSLSAFNGALSNLSDIIQRLTLFVQDNPELIDYLYSLSIIKPSDSMVFWQKFLEFLNWQFTMFKENIESVVTGLTDAYNWFAKLVGMKPIDVSSLFAPIETVKKDLASGGTYIPNPTANTKATYKAPVIPNPTANTKATYKAPVIPKTIINSKLADIYAYADGGYPTTGQLFIAREAGAELVGNIGGKTAVATNNDIVQAVAQGVASAVSSVMSGGSQTVELIVDDTTFGRVVINSANKVQRNTNLKLQTY